MDEMCRFSSFITGKKNVGLVSRCSVTASGRVFDLFQCSLQSQISVLQNRIEQLEQLLEENHQIISHIKDSVMELTDTGAVSPSGQLPFRSANGSWVLPFDGRPAFLAVKPQDCQFAAGSHGRADVQVRLPRRQIHHFKHRRCCTDGASLSLALRCAADAGRVLAAKVRQRRRRRVETGL